MDTNNDDPVYCTPDEDRYFNWRQAGWKCAIAPAGCANCAAQDERQRVLALNKASVTGAGT
jgi:hypothetical protein